MVVHPGGEGGGYFKFDMSSTEFRGGRLLTQPSRGKVGRGIDLVWQIVRLFYFRDFTNFWAADYNHRVTFVQEQTPVPTDTHVLMSSLHNLQVEIID